MAEDFTKVNGSGDGLAIGDRVNLIWHGRHNEPGVASGGGVVKRLTKRLVSVLTDSGNVVVFYRKSRNETDTLFVGAWYSFERVG